MGQGSPCARHLLPHSRAHLTLAAPPQAHHEVCPKFPLTCDGCGKKKVPREKVTDLRMVWGGSGVMTCVQRAVQ